MTRGALSTTYHYRDEQMGEALSQQHGRLEIVVDSTGIVVDLAVELGGADLRKTGAVRAYPESATVYYEQGVAPLVTDVNTAGDTFDLTHAGGAFTAGNTLTGVTTGAVGLITRVIDATTVRVVLQDHTTPFVPVEVINETPGPETGSLTAQVVAPVQKTSFAFEGQFMLDYTAIGPLFAFRCAAGESTTLMLTPMTASHIATHRVANGFVAP